MEFIQIGFLSSFQLSIPLIISHRRFLLEGKKSGLLSYFGLAVGQALFLIFMTSANRNVISIWYEFEPLLFLLGILISLNILFTFFRDSSNTSNLMGNRALRDSPFPSKAEDFKIFGLSLLLPLLNPVGIFFDLPSMTQFLVYHNGPSTVDILFLQISMFVGSVLLGFLLFNLVEWYLQVKLQPRVYIFRLVNSFITILGLIICLEGGFQFYWKLVYYPVDIIANNLGLSEQGASSSSTTSSEQGQLLSSSNPVSTVKFIKLFQRHIDKETSNRRNEEVNITLTRLVPIEKFKRDIRHESLYRASLLTDRKEAEIAYKYNQYPINKISFYFDKTFREMFTPFHLILSPQQEYELQLLRDEWVSKSNIYSSPTQNRGKNTKKLASSFAQPAALL